MALIKKLLALKYKIKKHFRNKKFKDKVQKEKSKKYLYKTNSKNTKNTTIFDFYKKQKKFSSYILSAGENIKSYKIFYAGIGLVLISLCAYIIVISPYFRISSSKLIIERLDTITDINMAYKSIEKVYGESIFMLDKEDIRNSLTSFQKNIKNVSITRLFPNGLKIVIDSYKPQFFTQFSGIDKKYIVTSNGVLIYEKNVDKILYNLEIVDNSLVEQGFFDYKEGIKPNTMRKIMFTRDMFKEIFTNKNIAKFVYFRLENEIHISLETGTKIILELNEEIGKQLAMLKYYNDNNKDIISSGNIIYIDTRIFGKIYSCQEKVICQKNLERIYPSYYRK